MPMKWSRRPVTISRSARSRSSSPEISLRSRRARTSSAIRARRVGPGQRRRGGRHRRQARLVAEQGAELGRQAGSSLSSRSVDHGRRARVRHPGGVGALVVGGRVRVGDEDRRPAGGGDLEDRAARSGRGPGRRRRGSRRGRARTRAACSGRRAGRRRAARAAPRSRGGRRGGRRGSRDRSRSANAATAHSLIERAPWLPPMTSRQRSPAAMPKRVAGAAAVGLEHRRRHRPPGDQVAVALAARDREGEADPPGAPGEQAVGEAEVAVGLGQDQRRAAGAARPGRPGRRRSRRRPSPRRRRARGAPGGRRRPSRAPGARPRPP